MNWKCSNLWWWQSWEKLWWLLQLLIRVMTPHSSITVEQSILTRKKPSIKMIIHIERQTWLVQPQQIVFVKTIANSFCCANASIECIEIEMINLFSKKKFFFVRDETKQFINETLKSRFISDCQFDSDIPLVSFTIYTKWMEKRNTVARKLI